MTQHPHPPPRQQWPVLYLGERGTGRSGLSWRTTALWTEALPRTQSFPTLECSNFSHIKDWLVVSSSPRWRCALTLGVTTEPRIGTAAFWWNRGTEIPQIRWGRGLLTVARWQVRVGRWCVVGLGCTIQVWSWYYRPPDATRDVCLQTQPNVPCLGKTASQPHTTLTPLWRNISGNKLVS